MNNYNKMIKEKIDIDGKVFEVSELLAVDFDKIMNLKEENERIKNIVCKSTNITDDEFNNLTVKERQQIMKVINKLNGWSKEEDFQTPPGQEEKTE